MPVMRVREMRVGMRDWLMPVRMNMSGTRSDLSLVRVVVMPIARTMFMLVAVLNRFVHVRMRVAL